MKIVKPVTMKTSQVFKATGSQQKDIVPKTSPDGDEVTPRTLKAVPGQMTADKRAQMLAKIKGQQAMSSLKDQLAAAQ